jgi:hypothetical protein
MQGVRLSTTVSSPPLPPRSTWRRSRRRRRASAATSAPALACPSGLSSASTTATRRTQVDSARLRVRHSSRSRNRSHRHTPRLTALATLQQATVAVARSALRRSSRARSVRRRCCRSAVAHLHRRRVVPRPDSVCHRRSPVPSAVVSQAMLEGAPLRARASPAARTASRNTLSPTKMLPTPSLAPLGAARPRRRRSSLAARRSCRRRSATGRAQRPAGLQAVLSRA